MTSKWKNIAIALAVVLAIGIGIGAGYVIWGGLPQTIYVPQPPPPSDGSGAPATLPQHYTLSFTLEPTQNRYSFPIYLRTDWTLHISWWTDEGDREVAFGFIAPCGDQYGYTGTGSLPAWQPGLIHPESEGSTVLELAKYHGTSYKFDNGYYEFIAYGGSAATHWHVQYWIED